MLDCQSFEIFIFFDSMVTARVRAVAVTVAVVSVMVAAMMAAVVTAALAEALVGSGGNGGTYVKCTTYHESTQSHNKTGA